VDQTVFHIDFGEAKTIAKFAALISDYRLVVMASMLRPLHLKDRCDILIWDWRNGHRMLVSLHDTVVGS
jgi:hypothetical protein